VEIDSLLYLPGHAPRDLTRALRIPALSDGWRGSFRALLEQADGRTTVLAWEGLRPLRVVAIERESTSVVSVRLVPADDRPAVPALPGQFLTVRLKPDRAAAPILRTYSFTGAPNTQGYRISVKREPHGAASGYLHTGLRVGDVIEAGAPRGSFVLREAQRPVVLISAGVGATPVLAMLHVLAAEHSARQVWWLHGARNRAEHPFAQESRALLDQLRDARGVVWYSQPDPDDRDFDGVGRLDAEVLDQLGVPTGADFYLCGPGAFMHDIAAGLTARGVPPERVSTEIFGPSDPQTPGIIDATERAPHPPTGAPGSGPMISFSRSNLSVAWDPAFANLLELAEACDVPVRWSCRTGVCQECRTGLVSGGVTYQPDPLEPPPPGSALICCSQPSDEVTLDL
jgi:ferredoxin-NADP reductase